MILEDRRHQEFNVYLAIICTCNLLLYDFNTLYRSEFETGNLICRIKWVTRLFKWLVSLFKKLDSSEYLKYLKKISSNLNI